MTRSARPDRSDAYFTALRVAYLVHEYDLRLRYDRLRDRGMLAKSEAAARLGILRGDSRDASPVSPLRIYWRS